MYSYGLATLSTLLYSFLPIAQYEEYNQTFSVSLITISTAYIVCPYEAITVYTNRRSLISNIDTEDRVKFTLLNDLVVRRSDLPYPLFFSHVYR